MELKEAFASAQKNGSLMWETVISFDNRWLKNMGVYEPEGNKLNEKELRRVVRLGINTLLEKENLQNSIWSASFHYDTDNIHLHLASVEPVPMREKRSYLQYKVVKKDGKWQYKRKKNPQTGKYEKIPLLDSQGRQVVKEQFVGKFKDSSLKAAKKVIVSELANTQEISKEINRLIREEIVNDVKKHDLYNDEAFRQKFISIYERLPENRGVANYNNSAMAHLRSEIDQLSMMYIDKYHKDEYEQLIKHLYRQNEAFKLSYGGENSQYMDNKTKELFYRLGNAILTEMKALDKQASGEVTIHSLRGKEEPMKKKKSGKKPEMRKNKFSSNHLADSDVKAALYWLKRALHKEYQSYINQSDYWELQRKINQSNESDYTGYEME